MTDSSGPHAEGRMKVEADPPRDADFRSLFEQSLDAVLLTTPGGAVLAANPAACRMFGYSEAELVSLGRAAVVDLADPRLAAALEERKRTGSFSGELTFLRKDGSRVPVELTSRVFRDASGEERTSMFIRDATERRRQGRDRDLLAAAGEVFASSFGIGEMLRSVAALLVREHADWCVIDVLSDEGTLEVVEAVAADPRKQALLQTLLERYPHSTSPERHPVGRVLQTGEAAFLPGLSDALLREAVEDEEHYRLVQQLDPRSSLVVPLVDRGRIHGALALTASESGRVFDTRDLELATELGRRAAVAVGRARLHERVERAVQARDLVMAYVAHDLRNPLSAISAFTDMLLHDAFSEAQQQRYLRAVLQAAAQIDRLIQDLLDVARVEAGRLGVEPRPDTVERLVQSAMLVLGPTAAEGAIEVGVELPDAPLWVLADHGRVVQVLQNLVGNAIKFTPSGGSVTLRAAATEEEVHFSVSDTGPGIPEQDLPQVFDRFWKAQRTRRAGAGLGLAIARGIVEAHGGRIWVESEVEQGTVFHFTLPTARGAAAGEDVDATSPGAAWADAPERPVRILLAEDHPLVRRGLKELLAREKRFVVVGEAVSGEDAVRMAAELLPDVMVMDLGLVGMGGIEATRRITTEREEVRVLVLTAEPEDAALLTVLEAGGSGFVRKADAHRELVPALRAVARGEVFLRATHSHLLLRGFREAVRRKSADPLARLTAHERSVALLTARGFTSREIGRRLSLSPRTVDSYRSHAMKTLGLAHRAELVQLVLRSDLLDPAPLP